MASGEGSSSILSSTVGVESGGAEGYRREGRPNMGLLDCAEGGGTYGVLEEREREARRSGSWVSVGVTGWEVEDGIESDL